MVSGLEFGGHLARRETHRKVRSQSDKANSRGSLNQMGFIGGCIMYAASKYIVNYNLHIYMNMQNCIRLVLRYMHIQRYIHEQLYKYMPLEPVSSDQLMSTEYV